MRQPPHAACTVCHYYYYAAIFHFAAATMPFPAADDAISMIYAAADAFATAMLPCHHIFTITPCHV